MVRAVLSLFLLVTKRLYGKEREWSIGQIKTCRKKQHVKIDDMKEMSDLFCSKAAVGGNYNSTRDNKTRIFIPFFVIFRMVRGVLQHWREMMREIRVVLKIDQADN